MQQKSLDCQLLKSMKHLWIGCCHVVVVLQHCQAGCFPSCGFVSRHACLTVLMLFPELSSMISLFSVCLFIVITICSILHHPQCVIFLCICFKISKLLKYVLVSLSYWHPLFNFLPMFLFSSFTRHFYCSAYVTPVLLIPGFCMFIPIYLFCGFFFAIIKPWQF